MIRIIGPNPNHLVIYSNENTKVFTSTLDFRISAFLPSHICFQRETRAI
jgi:hypothetical protein